MWKVYPGYFYRLFLMPLFSPWWNTITMPFIRALSCLRLSKSVCYEEYIPFNIDVYDILLVHFMGRLYIVYKNSLTFIGENFFYIIAFGNLSNLSRKSSGRLANFFTSSPILELNSADNSFIKVVSKIM